MLEGKRWGGGRRGDGKPKKNPRGIGLKAVHKGRMDLGKGGPERKKLYSGREVSKG